MWHSVRVLGASYRDLARVNVTLALVQIPWHIYAVYRWGVLINPLTLAWYLWQGLGR